MARMNQMNELREDFQCRHCYSMLIKVYGEDFEKPERVAYNCPACSKQLYSKRTTKNVKIRLNEK
ncbi:hypothetical protein [Vagococcus intermedius]|uniref:Uncharacterized protein n=1 Tax=Vagococcus intermedius TaxID=2991418 RepID=A0AAF0I917_9ENTE|nr:hypothetical protein [Vagococcus intermedius]WEG73052.1 hypothetical protein OL234_08790 [Vagococcus intermedius]WEG75136.1 hypothetical protein OL235_08785 [Vagococcus intermedius]